jgi:LysM repeat protein
LGLSLALSLLTLPQLANASLFTTIWAGIVQVFESKTEKTALPTVNSQNVPILQPNRAVDSDMARGGGDITVLGGTALMPESGPVGTMADIGEATSETISTYVVRKGDTISGIAQMFNVTSNTVRWANDISGSTIREGQLLIILPISGVKHTVQKGDTLSSIAKKYKADLGEISRYNSIAPSQVLTPGIIVMVPDGEIASVATRTTVQGTGAVRGGGPAYEGYYLRPILGGIKTQGLHGYNAVDLATYSGAPVFASADGTVIVSASSGWNGGYGNYIVITHGNGTQTLYSHLSAVSVSTGDRVDRGQQIGAVGSSGKSTGPHLHFEIRGAKNPF